MPELPEVESVRVGLMAARFESALIKVWRSKYNLRVGQDWTREREKLQLLRNCIPGPVDRRGKYLMWKMQASQTSNRPGEGEKGLVIHLGMSGQCEVVRTQTPLRPHTHLRLQFADGRELRFVDPRRFGGLRAGTWKEVLAFPPIANLGIEPLSRQFNGNYLRRQAGNSQRILRDVLLDQKIIAGVGNIYAIEALFVAGLHPLVPAQQLKMEDWDRVVAAIRSVLRKGIRNGGTTLKDFRDVSGAKGTNQDRLLAYGRAGKNCGRCDVMLQSFSHGGRTGTFCPMHQGPLLEN